LPRLTLLPLLVFALAAPVVGQEGVATSDRSEALPLATRDLLDPDPSTHLGWGTLEDVVVDLGAGAAVSLLSGNLVLEVDPLGRTDLPVGARMAFTYNHQEPEGAPDLAPGWTYDLARSVAAGPWGERVVVDADGFRDSLWAGEPPSAEELDRVTGQVVAAWRRDTSPADRRALGGVRALEELLVSDPVTLGAMRLRYMGPPDSDEDDPVWRSRARGGRALAPDGAGWTLALPDGSTESYSETGHLAGIAPAAGDPWTLNREHGSLRDVSIGNRIVWRLETDSRFRVQLIDGAGSKASLEYGGSLLQRIESAAGEWRFRYDERSRLAEARTPRGAIQVRYDDATGRVRDASGPTGAYRFGAAIGDNGLRVDVDGLAGGTATVAWDPELRTRTLTRGGVREERVVFEPLGAQPVEVEHRGVTTTFAWDGSGRLVGASGLGREVRWERDPDGKLTALVDAARARGPVESSGFGVRAWSDPAGRRTLLDRDGAGRIQSASRPGGPDLTFRRHPGGALASIGVLGGADVELPAPGRSVGELGLDTASAGVRRAGGRITGFESPTGRAVRLSLGPGGRVEQVRDDRTAVDVRYDGALLGGWSGPEGSRTVRRDGAGRPTGFVEGGAPRWDLRRDGSGRIDRVLLDGAELGIGWERSGSPARWQRPGRARIEVDRDGDDSVESYRDGAHGELALELDDAGRPIAVRRGAGRWTISRDRSGRVQRVAAPGGGVDFTLDDAGRPRSAAAPGLAWTLGRDPLGRLATVQTPEATFAVEHDRFGSPVRWVRPDGTAGTVVRDVRGRWTGMTLPDGDVSVRWGLMAPSTLLDLQWRVDAAGALVGWGPPEDGELRWFVDREASGHARRVRGGLREVGLRWGDDGRATQLGALTVDWTEGGLDGLLEGDVAWRVVRDDVGRVRGLESARGAVTLLRSVQGDVVGVDGLAELTRDPAGRLSTLTLDGALGFGAWTLERDELGRVLRVTSSGEVAFDWPDGASSPDLIADALGVTTDEKPQRRQPSGSWDARILDGAVTLAEYQARPEPGGRHTRAWTLPAGLAEQLPPATLDGLPLRGPSEPPVHLVGDAARVERWWAGRAPRVQDLALMPEGVPESARAWRSARLAAINQAAHMPEDVGRAGVGALVPPVPGASALAPGPGRVRTVSATEAMVLAGDLPAEALLWTDLAVLPDDAWRIEVPGAAVLAAIRGRLTAPTRPPMRSEDGIAAIAPGAQGILTSRGAEQERRRAWDVTPLLPGLPPGTVDVLPGTPGWIAATPGSTSADGRATVWDALSDPLGTPDGALAQARADSVLLALHAWSEGAAGSLGGTLPDPSAEERWLIETPAGNRVVVDGRGRLLSIDAGGRLIRAWADAASSLVARQVLAPTLDSFTLQSSGDDSPWTPPYLPSRGATVEARWGLVPAMPELPVDAFGGLALDGFPGLP